MLAKVMARAEAVGLTQHDGQRAPGSTRACFGAERGFERYPLLRGHKTGSRDGEPRRAAARAPSRLTTAAPPTCTWGR